MRICYTHFQNVGSKGIEPFEAIISCDLRAAIKWWRVTESNRCSDQTDQCRSQPQWAILPANQLGLRAETRKDEDFGELSSFKLSRGVTLNKAVHSPKDTAQNANGRQKIFIDSICCVNLSITLLPFKIIRGFYVPGHGVIASLRCSRYSLNHRGFSC